GGDVAGPGDGRAGGAARRAVRAGGRGSCPAGGVGGPAVPRRRLPAVRRALVPSGGRRHGRPGPERRAARRTTGRNDRDERNDRPERNDRDDGGGGPMTATIARPIGRPAPAPPPTRRRGRFLAHSAQLA